MNHVVRDWINRAILLSSIGIASIGDFIYLVAINIIVYQLTGSAVAVAGLWIVGPLTNILTKFWTEEIRLKTKNLKEDNGWTKITGI